VPASVLTGEGVLLRPITPDDAAPIGAILEEPEVARWWRRGEWERVAEERATTFAIVLDGQVVGCIQYTEETDPDYRSAAVDVFVAGRVQGRGVGSDAMRTLMRHLTEEREHHRLTVDPALANERAIHVYEKLGFCRVGVMRRYECGDDGVWRDALLMELVVEP